MKMFPQGFFRGVASVCAAVLLPLQVLGAVPPILDYQGSIQVDGTPFTGTGEFKFALVDAGTDTGVPATATATVTSGFITGISVDNPGAGYTTVPAVTISDSSGTGATVFANISGGKVASITVQNAGSGYSSNPTVTIEPPAESLEFVTYWSHDGTSVDGSEPAGAVALEVDAGLFNAGLGDEDLAGMSALPGSVFDNPDVHLRIWFNDGVNGFSRLNPDQPLHSVPYALRAESVPDGAVGTSQLAGESVNSSVIQDGSILPTDIDPGVGLWQATGTTLHYDLGRVFMGRNTPLTPAEQFGFTAPGSGFGGMYIHMESSSGQPFYGYSAGNRRMWTEYDGESSVWKVVNGGNRLTVTQNGQVGINTDDPGVRFHISDSDSGIAPANDTQVVLENTGIVGLALQTSASSVTYNHHILFKRSLNEIGKQIYARGDHLGIANYTETQFGVNRTTLFTLDNDGTAQIRGALGVNNRNPTSNELELIGNASKTVAGDWLANSDRRIKKDIRDIDHARETLLQLRPVKFRYTEEWRRRNPEIEDRDYYNFIAQEYQEVFPESVKGSGEHLEEGGEILQVDPYNAQVVAIKAVQELIEENRRLKQELHELRHTMDQRLKRLESDPNRWVKADKGRNSSSD